MKKQCRKCLKVLDLECFSNSKDGKYGKKSRCIKCRLEEDVSYKKSKKGVISRIYSVQKLSSKKRGHTPPAYTKKELEQWLYSQPNFDKLYNEWVESGYQRLKSVSVDRLDNNKPYSFDNIQLVDWVTNIRNYDGEALFKEVIAISNETNEVIGEYKSCAEASDIHNVSRATVTNSCMGKYKTRGKVRFQYKNK